MNLITLDFETYYDTEYSLSKMSAEDYVTDPRFEIIIAGVKINDEPPKCFIGGKKYLAEKLEACGLWDSCVIAHHAIFDMLILAVHFGRLPKMMLCTRMMANPFLRPLINSVSLKNCLEFLDLGMEKGTEVQKMLGRTLASLTTQERRNYGIYCMNDCEGEFRLFKYLAPMFPRQELRLIDMTLRMYLEPRLMLDAKVLAEQLQVVRAKKQAQMNALPASITADRLKSNPKFADLLRELGVEVPMKVSPTTDLPTFAFAKTDTGWKELEEEYEDDPLISAVLSARLGAKSTLEETRTVRLLDIANTHAYFRVPLLYYAAHTGRYGGMEKINPQNFPRTDKSRMRYAIKAPKHHVVLAADLSQIEARMTAFLAGQTDLLDAFRRGDDIYSAFAQLVFRQQVVKGRSTEDDRCRFVGKTCILGLGYGMGAAKLQSTLRKDGLVFDLLECDHMVRLYRTTYSSIHDLWYSCDKFIPHIATGETKQKLGPVVTGKNLILLPNGMPLQYHKLRYRDGSADGQNGWFYNFGNETRSLWGGKVVENIVQALARIVIMDNMVKIRSSLDLPPVLQQHDELDYVVPEDEAEEYKKEIGRIMRVPPVWAPTLPVEVEIAYGPTLGHCK